MHLWIPLSQTLIPLSNKPKVIKITGREFKKKFNEKKNNFKSGQIKSF